MKAIKLLVTLMLLGALAAGTVLVRKNQETRKGAYFGKVGVSVLPDNRSVGIGEEITVKIKMTTDEKKVSGVNLKLNYNDELVEITKMEVNRNVFETVSKEEKGGGKVWIVAMSPKATAELPSGVFDVATLTVKGKRNGRALLDFGKEYEIVGLNALGTDSSLEADLKGASYEIGSGSEETGNTVDFALVPAGGTLEKGKEIQAEVRLKTGTAKVSAVRLRIKFDRTKLKVVNLVKGANFDSAPVLRVDGAGGVIDLSLLSMKASGQLPSGEIKLVNFGLLGIAEGNGKIELDKSYSYEIVGYDSGGGENKMKLGKVEGGDFVVKGTATATVTPVVTGGKAEIEFRPQVGSLVPGEKTKVGMWLKTGETRVSAVRLRVGFNRERIRISDLVRGEGFDSAPVLMVDENKGLIDLSLLSMKASDELPKGEIKLAEFWMEALEEGKVEMEVNSDYEIISLGNNLGLKETKELVLTVVSAGGTGEGNMLNFRVSLGRLAGDAGCAKNLPLVMTVVGNGVSKVFSDVVLEELGEGLWGGALALNGFKQRENLSLYIRGPGYLQIKYGEDKQGKAYGSGEGRISLGEEKIYNFSNFPLIAGDVNEDGRINGMDFSEVKGKAMGHEMVGEKEFLAEDLDGNCQVNSNDVAVLKLSLSEREGDFY